MSEKPHIPTSPPLSKMAVASLALGMLGWFIVPALFAIITGIVALRTTRRRPLRGRGLALGGLVLGTIFGLVGIGVGAMFFQSYRWHMELLRSRIPQVVNAAADGDAATLAETSTLSADQVRALRERTAAWGRMNGVTTLQLTGERTPEHPDQVRLRGDGVFSQGGVKPFDVVIEARENDVLVAKIEFRDRDVSPTTQNR